MGAEVSPEIELVRHALAAARENRYATIELETDSLRFTAKLEPQSPAKKKRPPTLDSQAATAAAEKTASAIRAPMVGYFSPLPSGPQPGDTVQEGDVIGVISVLGIDNDIVSSTSGFIEAILVTDGDPVEYGQPLLKVVPA